MPQIDIPNPGAKNPEFYELVKTHCAVAGESFDDSFILYVLDNLKESDLKNLESLLILGNDEVLFHPVGFEGFGRPALSRLFRRAYFSDELVNCSLELVAEDNPGTVIVFHHYNVDKTPEKKSFYRRYDATKYPKLRFISCAYSVGPHWGLLVFIVSKGRYYFMEAMNAFSFAPSPKQTENFISLVEKIYPGSKPHSGTWEFERIQVCHQGDGWICGVRLPIYLRLLCSGGQIDAPFGAPELNEAKLKLLQMILRLKFRPTSDNSILDDVGLGTAH